MTRLRGKLVDWNDARGFGFILDEDGRRYFVHITAIARIATRPRVGDTVQFVPRMGSRRGLEARSVTIDGANPVSRPSRNISEKRDPDWQIVLAFTLVGVLAYLIWRDPSAIVLGLVYLAVGAVSFYLYFSDKQAAEAQAWRVSETALHSSDLAFGIIGGLLAQALFRHKTRKLSFMLVTLAIGLGHVGLLVVLVMGDIKLEWVLSRFMGY